MYSISSDGELGLAVNDSSVDESKIWCFSDSVIFYPSKVKLSRVGDSNDFVLKPLTDGYYWCIHADTKNFRVSESNKALFIREKSSTLNLYAIKIRVKRKYSLENLEKPLKEWSEKLSEYIYLRTKYAQVYGSTELALGEKTEDVLKRFKKQNVGGAYKESLFNFLKVKRLFLDRKTILVHAQVKTGVEAVVPGEWEGLEIVFMKPAYYCKGFDNVPTLPLGEYLTIDTYTRYNNEDIRTVETENRLYRKRRKMRYNIIYIIGPHSSTAGQGPHHKSRSSSILVDPRPSSFILVHATSETFQLSSSNTASASSWSHGIFYLFQYFHL